MAAPVFAGGRRRRCWRLAEAGYQYHAKAAGMRGEMLSGGDELNTEKDMGLV